VGKDEKVNVTSILGFEETLVHEREMDLQSLCDELPEGHSAKEELKKLKESQDEIDGIPPNVRRIWKEVRATVRDCGGSL